MNDWKLSVATPTLNEGAASKDLSRWTVNTDPLLTAAEAAKQLNVTRQHVNHLAKRGLLRSVRVGRSVRFRQTWITQFIDRER